MGIARVSLYLIGGALIVGGLALLYFETGLVEFVPVAVAAAILLVLVGLLVLGVSSRVREPLPEERVESHHHHDRDDDTNRRAHTENEPEARPTAARVQTYERTTTRPEDRTIGTSEAQERRAKQKHGTRQVRERYSQRDYE